MDTIKRVIKWRVWDKDTWVCHPFEIKRALNARGQLAGFDLTCDGENLGRFPTVRAAKKHVEIAGDVPK